MNKEEIKKLASFITKAVEDLQNGGEGCWHYHLGRNLYYVIACAGAKGNYDEEDFENFATDDTGEYAICGKIAVNIDDLQCDYEYDWYMPYDKETMDVWDTEREFYKNNNFEQVAEEILLDYEQMSRYEIDNKGIIRREKMYLYRLRDNEEDRVDYEDFIITKENVKNLIEDCAKLYADAIDYDSVTDYLEDNEDLKLDVRLERFLNKHSMCDVNSFGNAVEFVLDVLEENNIEILKFEEQNIWY